MSEQHSKTLPSIRNRALLVNLAFHKPPMTKTDWQATQDTEAKHNAKGGLRTQKMLYPKHMIAPIVAVEAEARGYLRSNAIEWGASGMYLLDTSRYMEVRQRLSEYELARSQEVTKFAQDWANVLTQAEKQQGDLFDPSLYPDVSSVVPQFTMSIFVAPMGDMAPDMFTDIEEELRARIREDVEVATAEAVAGAVAQPLARLLEAVLNLYDKTSRDKARIHDSIVDQVQEIAELMPSLNLLELPQLDAIARVCTGRLNVEGETLRGKDNEDNRKALAGDAEKLLKVCGVSAEDLRQAGDQKARKHTAQKTAQTIVDRMEAFT